MWRLNPLKVLTFGLSGNSLRSMKYCQDSLPSLFLCLMSGLPKCRTTFPFGVPTWTYRSTSSNVYTRPMNFSGFSAVSVQAGTKASVASARAVMYFASLIFLGFWSAGMIALVLAGRNGILSRPPFCCCIRRGETLDFTALWERSFHGFFHHRAAFGYLPTAPFSISPTCPFVPIPPFFVVSGGLAGFSGSFFRGQRGVRWFQRGASSGSARGSLVSAEGSLDSARASLGFSGGVAGFRFSLFSSYFPLGTFNN